MAVPLDEFDDILNTKTETPNKVDGIEFSSLSEEAKEVYDVLQNTRTNVFLTGDAGTGKTTLINFFRNNTKKNVVFLAPTGVAATHIKGQTIHSFFKFGPKLLVEQNIPTTNDWNRHLYRNVDAIVLDEVSMCRVDLLNAIDLFYRKNYGSHRPFGGKQIIMVGDLAQLPPVLAKHTNEDEYIREKFKSEFFFDCPALEESGYEKYRLSHVYRQTDMEFVDILNRIRKGEFTDSDINRINEVSYKRINEDSESITLCSTNAVADRINKIEMFSMTSEEHLIEGIITGNFHEKSCRVPLNLKLKEGSKIMMMANDSTGRWYNGSMATFLSYDKKSDTVQILYKGKEYTVERYEWEYNVYDYDKHNDSISQKSLGTYKNFPLVPDFAISIHKSQGLTFDNINIDFGTGAFEHGMVYVALSRCRTLQGISLLTKLKRSDIKYNARVLEFNKTL